MISVVVPAFNAEATLAATLVSVLSQTCAPTEVVVVDDGSTDGTSAVARPFPVKVIRHATNLGVSAAINTGLASTIGEVVAIVDADDLWSPGKLAIQHPLLCEAGVVVGHVREFVDAAEDVSRFRPRPVQAGWLYGASLVRRTLFDRVGGMNPALRTGAWVDWIARARADGAEFLVHSDVVLERRLRRGSLSATDRTVDLLRIARASVQRKRHG